MVYMHTVTYALQENANPKDFINELRTLCLKLSKDNIIISNFSHRQHDGSEKPNNNLYIFNMKFSNKEDFEKYLNHPLHQKFVEKALAQYISEVKDFVNGQNDASFPPLLNRHSRSYSW